MLRQTRVVNFWRNDNDDYNDGISNYLFSYWFLFSVCVCVCMCVSVWYIPFLFHLIISHFIILFTACMPAEFISYIYGSAKLFLQTFDFVTDFNRPTIFTRYHFCPWNRRYAPNTTRRRTTTKRIQNENRQLSKANNKHLNK